MFFLTSQPHRQIDRIWAPVPPNNVVERNRTTAAKCMARTGMVDGRCLPVVWFQGSVNGKVYLDPLKNTLWPAMRARATQKQYWYQHDGRTCHVTTEGLEFLHSKFGHRILSRRLDHHWPANSPDLSPIDPSEESEAYNTGRSEGSS